MSGTILDEIAAYARKRVENDKKICSLEELQLKCKDICRLSDVSGCENEIGSLSGGRFKGKFYEALSKDGLSFICEIKKASPSKGVISESFPYLEIAGEYSDAGADCISCLTEPKWFMGSDRIFEQVRRSEKIPMLRKDFVVDEYQIYQAKTMGADAVLIICAITPPEKIKEYLNICDELSIDALVEAHDRTEIDTAVRSGATIIGVNNRNLKDFTVDTSNAADLKRFIPDELLFVSESGILLPEDAARAYKAGADAVLIGEALMRAENKKELISKMRQAARLDR